MTQEQMLLKLILILTTQITDALIDGTLDTDWVTKSTYEIDSMIDELYKLTEKDTP